MRWFCIMSWFPFQNFELPLSELRWGSVDYVQAGQPANRAVCCRPFSSSALRLVWNFVRRIARAWLEVNGRSAGYCCFSLRKLRTFQLKIDHFFQENVLDSGGKKVHSARSFVFLMPLRFSVLEQCFQGRVGYWLSSSLCFEDPISCLYPKVEGWAKLGTIATL